MTSTFQTPSLTNLYYTCRTVEIMEFLFLIIIIIIIIIIVLVVTFLQSIYNYIPESDHIYRVHRAATLL